MEKTINTQEYIHRLKFCLRAVKLLDLGEVHVHSPHFKPIYQIIKGEIPTYTFSTLEKFERFVERNLHHRTALVISDKAIARRMNIRREERMARANGRTSYMFRSAM